MPAQRPQSGSAQAGSPAPPQPRKAPGRDLGSAAPEHPRCPSLLQRTPIRRALSAALPPCAVGLGRAAPAKPSLCSRSKRPSQRLFRHGPATRLLCPGACREVWRLARRRPSCVAPVLVRARGAGCAQEGAALLRGLPRRGLTSPFVPGAQRGGQAVCEPCAPTGTGREAT